MNATLMFAEHLGTVSVVDGRCRDIPRDRECAGDR